MTLNSNVDLNNLAVPFVPNVPDFCRCSKMPPKANMILNLYTIHHICLDTSQAEMFRGVFLHWLYFYMTFITIVSSHTHVVPQMTWWIYDELSFGWNNCKIQKALDTRYDTLYVYTYLHDAHQDQHQAWDLCIIYIWYLYNCIHHIKCIILNI